MLENLAICSLIRRKGPDICVKRNFWNSNVYAVIFGTLQHICLDFDEGKIIFRCRVDVV